MFEDCFSSSLGYSWCRILTFLKMVRGHVVVIRLMHDWVKVHLKAYSGASVEERRAWWITLKWYFGYCAKKELGEPTNRDNGKIFWRDAVLCADPEDWQKAQWGDALKWFFEELAARDVAGAKLRSALRRRHLAYTTEKAYMSWLRRFQAFLHPKEAMDWSREMWYVF